jgi:hypothetical protein
MKVDHSLNHKLPSPAGLFEDAPEGPHFPGDYFAAAVVLLAADRIRKPTRGLVRLVPVRELIRANLGFPAAPEPFRDVLHREPVVGVDNLLRGGTDRSVVLRRGEESLVEVHPVTPLVAFHSHPVVLVLRSNDLVRPAVERLHVVLEHLGGTIRAPQNPSTQPGVPALKLGVHPVLRSPGVDRLEEPSAFGFERLGLREVTVDADCGDVASCQIPSVSPRPKPTICCHIASWHGLRRRDVVETRSPIRRCSNPAYVHRASEPFVHRGRNRSPPARKGTVRKSEADRAGHRARNCAIFCYQEGLERKGRKFPNPENT